MSQTLTTNHPLSPATFLSVGASVKTGPVSWSRRFAALNSSRRIDATLRITCVHAVSVAHLKKEQVGPLTRLTQSSDLPSLPMWDAQIEQCLVLVQQTKAGAFATQAKDRPAGPGPTVSASTVTQQSPYSSLTGPERNVQR